MDEGAKRDERQSQHHPNRSLDSSDVTCHGITPPPKLRLKLGSLPVPEHAAPPRTGLLLISTFERHSGQRIH